MPVRDRWDVVLCWFDERRWRFRHPVKVGRVLLFTSGHGWFRFAVGMYDEVEPLLDDGSGPSFPVPYAPPLRRLWMTVTGVAHLALPSSAAVLMRTFPSFVPAGGSFTQVRKTVELYRQARWLDDFC